MDSPLQNSFCLRKKSVVKSKEKKLDNYTAVVNLKKKWTDIGYGTKPDKTLSLRPSKTVLQLQLLLGKENGT